MKEKTYKKLCVTLTWQFCLFVLTINIAASIFQAVEKQSGDKPNISKDDRIANFSLTHNITKDNVLKFVDLINNHPVRSSMTYMEALVLTLSLFYTIGKYIWLRYL